MSDQHQHLDDRLDRYLDGLMDEAQRTEFEQLLDHDDELRAQVDQQRNIDTVLNRLFKPTAASEVINATSHASTMANGAAPEPAIVEPTLTFQQGPSSASQHVTRLRARSFALAASLAMALVGGWLIWGALVPRPGYPEWRPMEVAFNEFAANDMEPELVCDSPEVFAAWFKQNHNHPLALAETLPAGMEVTGLAYRNTLSRRTICVLAWVDGEPVVVFVDRRWDDLERHLTPDSGLRVYQRRLGALRLYEVSRLDEPAILDFFYSPDEKKTEAP